MVFSWDQKESDANLLERGFDFQSVVFTDRPDPEGNPIRRIISARRSNRGEREAYEQSKTD